MAKMRVPTREVRSESTLRGLGEDEVPTRVVRLESTLRGRSAVEAGPAETGLRNGMARHFGVLRKMPTVVHVHR